jgi:hypothetical protein
MKSQLATLPLAKPDILSPRQYHTERISQAWRDSVEAIIETGRRVLDAKEKLPHGEFTAVVKNDLPFGPRTAERLMAVADNPVISNATHGSHLPPSWRTLYELTRLPTPVLEAKIADGTINPGMERKDAVALKRDGAQPGPNDSGLPSGGPHADCVQPERFAQRWNDYALAAAITRIMMAARRAPDAPEQGDGDPAEAARETIQELDRWVFLLKQGKAVRDE